MIEVVIHDTKNPLQNAGDFYFLKMKTTYVY